MFFVSIPHIALFDTFLKIGNFFNWVGYCEWEENLNWVISWFWNEDHTNLDTTENISRSYVIIITHEFVEGF